MGDVLIFLADGFEEIEALTVVDILRRGGASVKTVSINDSLTVEGSHGIKVLADMLFSDVRGLDFDMLVLPGGPGTKLLKNHQGLTGLLTANKDKHIAAICAAPSVLGGLNLLNGKSAVCYPGYENQLGGAAFVDEKVVVSGNIITSKAAGTAMDFAFAVLEVLKGRKVSDRVKGEIYF